jgi:hypothetical protein
MGISKVVYYNDDPQTFKRTIFLSLLLNFKKLRECLSEIIALLVFVKQYVSLNFQLFSSNLFPSAHTPCGVSPMRTFLYQLLIAQ